MIMPSGLRDRFWGVRCSDSSVCRHFFAKPRVIVTVFYFLPLAVKAWVNKLSHCRAKSKPLKPCKTIQPSYPKAIYSTADSPKIIFMPGLADRRGAGANLGGDQDRGR